MPSGDSDHMPASRGDLGWVNRDIQRELSVIKNLLIVCLVLLVSLVAHLLFGLQPFWK